MPAAPLPTIESDWQALVAAYGAVHAACATAGPATFAQELARAERQALNDAPAAKLTADLTQAGYCFPATNCPPPYKVGS